MKVALIGKGPGWELAPLMGKGVTTWGVNDSVAHRECDVCFWMDRHLMKDTQMDKLVTVSVNTTNTPMYSVQEWDDIPSSVTYPRDEIFKAFGTDFFADSLSYMIALAIYQGFDTFDLYGFNYSHGSMYMQEKSCAQHWLGVALGMGLTVNVYGEHCEFFKTKDGIIYSYEDEQSYPRTNMRIPRFSFPEEDIALNVMDRIMLQGLLPKMGNHQTLEFANRLRDELFFDTKQAKELNMRQVNINTDKPQIIWDDNEIPDKAIRLTVAEKSSVAAWVCQLDKEDRLTNQTLGLYKKFCVSAPGPTPSRCG